MRNIVGFPIFRVLEDLGLVLQYGTLWSSTYRTIHVQVLNEPPQPVNTQHQVPTKVCTYIFASKRLLTKLAYNAKSTKTNTANDFLLNGCLVQR